MRHRGAPCLRAAPVRVEYELTPKGRALEPAVSALRTWAREWLQY